MTEIATQQTITDPCFGATHVGRTFRRIDPDVPASRAIDFDAKFLPDSLSRVHDIDFLNDVERKLLSQVQGRTCVNMLRLLDFVIDNRMSDLRGAHPGGATAMRHRREFRRIDDLVAAGMPVGYEFAADGRNIATAVLSCSDWAGLGFSFHTELATQAHYQQSIFWDPELSGAFKDAFRLHRREELRHTIIDGIEWARADALIDPAVRDRAIGEIIALLTALDHTLQLQADADVNYFLAINSRAIGAARRERVLATVLAAYRWQYIGMGLKVPRFINTLRNFVSAGQFECFKQAAHSLVDRPVLH